MSSRTLFRGIMFAIRRPRLALFITGVVLVIPAAIFIYMGVRYVIGDLNRVDLNSPDCDLASIENYNRVSGNTYKAWGSFYIPASDGSKIYYYIVPQFDDDSDPQYIEKVLVVKVEPEYCTIWNTVSDHTKQWFSHLAQKPITPIQIDGYAHEMSGIQYSYAMDYLQNIGFSYSNAEKVLVPYFVADNSSALYTTFTAGGVFALISIICFGIWFALGANFRD